MRLIRIKIMPKQVSKPKCSATSVIFIKLPKVNNRPIGENSPNLVTLNITFDNDDTFRHVRAQLVGGDDLVLPRVAGLSVDDFDGQDAVCVGNGKPRGVQLLASLQPLYLEVSDKTPYI
jgi:hypothetical protein